MTRVDPRVTPVTTLIVRGSSDGGSPMPLNRTRIMQAIAGAVYLLMLAGCTQPDVEPTGATSTTVPSATATTTTPPSTVTIDPAVAEAEELVLQTYRGYWAAKVASYADPTQPQDPNLEVFAVDTALADAQATIGSMRAEGIYVPGEPVLTPEVTVVDLDAQTATIVDCVDTANWQGLFVATHESAVAPDQFTRVTAGATARVYDGQWVIDTYRVYREQTC